MMDWERLLCLRIFPNYPDQAVQQKSCLETWSNSMEKPTK